MLIGMTTTLLPFRECLPVTTESVALFVIELRNWVASFPHNEMRCEGAALLDGTFMLTGLG